MTASKNDIPVIKGAKKQPKVQELTKELREVKKEARKEIEEIKQVAEQQVEEVKQLTETEKKELKRKTVEAKREINSLTSENQELKDLLVNVIKQQNKSRWAEYINILCWIICFILIIIQSVK